MPDESEHDVQRPTGRRLASADQSDRAAFGYWREHVGTLRLDKVTPELIALHRDLLQLNRWIDVLGELARFRHPYLGAGVRSDWRLPSICLRRC